MTNPMPLYPSDADRMVEHMFAHVIRRSGS